MLVLILLCLVIAVPETEAKVTFFPQRNNGGPIFHRPSFPSDVYNGHAKPKDKLQITLIAPANVTASKEVEATSTSTSAPVTRPPEPPSKYFVTWRPEVTDSRQVIITVRTRPPSPSPLLSLANPEYRPQHFFSELAAAPASTLPPFLLETAVSLTAPRPGTRAPAATPAWQFTPVFNPIFSAVTSTTSSPGTTAKYGATFKFAKKTTTPRYSAYQEIITKSTTIASVITTTRSTSTTKTTTTTTTTLPTSSSSSHSFISKLSVNKTISGGELEQFPPVYNYNYNAPVSAAVGLEDEDTIFKNPTTFIAYIRYLLATFLRLEPI